MSAGRALLVAATIAMTASGARPARSDTVRLVVAGGASMRGAAARAELATQLGPVVAAIRADDTAARLAAVVGIGPRTIHHRVVAARWDRACLDRLADPTAHRDRCWIDGTRRTSSTRDAADGWLGAVAGVRRDDLGRIAAIAAIRIHPTDDVLGDVIELGASGVVAGRDRPFVQHMRFAPGWYVRAQSRIWHVVIGGEIGTTGLASRTEMGTFRAEVFATATVGVAVGL